MKFTPESTAAAIILSTSDCGTSLEPKRLVPKPKTETRTPAEPNWRYSMQLSFRLGNSSGRRQRQYNHRLRTDFESAVNFSSLLSERKRLRPQFQHSVNWPSSSSPQPTQRHGFLTDSRGASVF